MKKKLVKANSNINQVVGRICEEKKENN